MKKLFCAVALLGWILIGRAQNFAHFPAFQPWALRWDNANPAAFVLSFDLYFGPNKIATLTTNDYTLESTDANGVQTFRALVPAVLIGTNLITMTASDGNGNRSAPSLPLTVLGEFLPPRNLRP